MARWNRDRTSLGPAVKSRTTWASEQRHRITWAIPSWRSTSLLCLEHLKQEMWAGYHLQVDEDGGNSIVS